MLWVLLLSGCFFPDPADVEFAPEPTPTPVEEVVVDDDGDGWTVEAGDCDDGDPFVHPQAEEVFDLLVNDCDSAILREEFSVQFDTPRITGPGEYANFGESVSVGDLDGDGRADLCARGRAGSDGAGTEVFVFLDVVATMEQAEFVDTAAASVVLEGLERDGPLDCSRDIGGDGFDDLLVSSWFNGLDGSGFYVFSGGPDFGATETLAVGDASARIEGDEEARVGLCFGVGDVLPEPGLEVLVGEAINIIGDAYDRRLRLMNADLTVELLTIETPGADYATNVCPIVPDLSGDGYDDIVVADPMPVTLYLSERLQVLAPDEALIEITDDEVMEVVGADFDGDGLGDLLLSKALWSPGEEGENWWGFGYVLWGQQGVANWLLPAVDPFSFQVEPGRGFALDGPGAGSVFGWSAAAVGDLNDDRRPEFAVSAPGMTNQRGGGEVFFFSGRDRDDWDALGSVLDPSDADSVVRGGTPSAGLELVLAGSNGSRWTLDWEDPATERAPGVWIPMPSASFGVASQSTGALTWFPGR